jgi:hypothetical protein
MAEAWERWVPVADSLVLQAYYRVLSFVSFHAPIEEAIQAVKRLADTKRGGTVYTVIPDRVYRWDGLEVFPNIHVNLWIFGSPMRKKNTVYARVGFWTLTLMTEALRARTKRLASSS